MATKAAGLDGRPAFWQRALVPNEWYASRPGRSLSDWSVDAALFVGAVAVGAFTLAHIWASRAVAVDVGDLVCGSAACVALWARRSRPMLVVLLAAGGLFSALAIGAALVAVFNAAVRGPARTVVVAAVLAVAGSTVFPLVNPAAGAVFDQRFPGFMLMAIAFGWGFYVRARRQLVVSLRDRADRLEADQLRASELAREAERRRIAREMHDVLAHRLSLLSVHAGALEFRPGAPPAEISLAAAVIRASAVAALNELRQVITVLREDPGGTGAPQPTLAQLPALLEESIAAGMSLRAEVDVAEPATVPDALGRTAYRVVQEGLTNARKHAPGGAVAVKVMTDSRGILTVEVVSRPIGGQGPPGPASWGPASWGPASWGPASSGPASSGPASAPTGPGTGLIGLAERLALVGGRLEHSLSTEGEFVLRATVPRTG